MWYTTLPGSVARGSVLRQRGSVCVNIRGAVAADSGQRVSLAPGGARRGNGNLPVQEKTLGDKRLPAPVELEVEAARLFQP